MSHDTNQSTAARRSRIRMLRPLRRSTDAIRRRRFRRGVYLLPSMFTMASMFCGYACIVYAMRGEFATAAPFIGWAIVADMFDGRIARMTGTESEFGVEFDSMADIISFGIAPAILSFAWGLAPLGRLGWAIGFVFVAAAAIRLARFNIQSASPSQDKRYFVGMPSPAAAGIPAATVYMYPAGFQTYTEALPVLDEHAEEERKFWGAEDKHGLASEAEKIHEQARAALSSPNVADEPRAAKTQDSKST